MTEAEYDNIDCLICHAKDYRRKVVKEGDAFKFAPADGVDILKAAQSVGRSTSEMCLRCHLSTGGGPNHKHGVTPTEGTDVHMAKGKRCTSCHKFKGHKTIGASDIKAVELPKGTMNCDGCHMGHKGAQKDALNAHKRVACQTCHIPAIARDPAFPTTVARDWTKPVLNEKTGLYGPTNTMAGNVKPEYRWWNRRMTSPPEPVGSKDDKKSKIYPWKRTAYTVIADEKSGHPVYIKAGTYSITGDPGAAAKKGAEDAQQEYSGAWKGVTETMVFSVNHQVAPKEQALGCKSCHVAEGGLLDWKALGYSEEEIKKFAAVTY
jgi:hypothetical protein